MIAKFFTPVRDDVSWAAEYGYPIVEKRVYYCYCGFVGDRYGSGVLSHGVGYNADVFIGRVGN